MTKVLRNNAFPFRVLPDFHFPALSLSPGQRPAQDDMCPSVGNRLISVPIMDTIACALVCPMPVTSSMTAWYSVSYQFTLRPFVAKDWTDGGANEST